MDLSDTVKFSYPEIQLVDAVDERRHGAEEEDPSVAGEKELGDKESCSDPDEDVGRALPGDRDDGRVREAEVGDEADGRDRDRGDDADAWA